MRSTIIASKRRAVACLLGLGILTQPLAHAYVVNHTIAATGGCPEPNRFDVSTPMTKKISRRWSTSLNTNPVTIKTVAQPGTQAQITEIDTAVSESFSVWTSVGTALTQNTLGPLVQTSVQNACTTDQQASSGVGLDGLNSICFNQSSISFTGGVLAFTRVINSDILGEHPYPNNQPSVIVGEILDADILFRPNDPSITFATPQALSANPNSYDFESVLIHELGHFFGFSHSAVLRAMMYPFASDPGTFLGVRPSVQPDGPLADDDRAGLRVLYPNPGDPNVGIISGFILPANPLSLAGLPSPSPGRSVTGIFGAHVVAVDADTGAVVAGTLGGWSCNLANLPTQFDGFYKIEGLPVADMQGNPRHYKIFVEPLDRPTDSTNINSALLDLCRQDVPLSCIVPGSVLNAQGIPVSVTVNTNFTSKIKP